MTHDALDAVEYLRRATECLCVNCRHSMPDCCLDPGGALQRAARCHRPGVPRRRVVEVQPTWHARRAPRRRDVA